MFFTCSCLNWEGIITLEYISLQHILTDSICNEIGSIIGIALDLIMVQPIPYLCSTGTRIRHAQQTIDVPFNGHWGGGQWAICPDYITSDGLIKITFTASPLHQHRRHTSSLYAPWLTEPHPHLLMMKGCGYISRLVIPISNNSFTSSADKVRGWVSSITSVIYCGQLPVDYYLVLIHT